MNSPYDNFKENEREKYNALHALYQTLKHGESDLKYTISKEMSKIDGKSMWCRF